MNIYGFGQYAFDNWRNFILLKEIPAIEEGLLNWLIVLWVQIFLITVALTVGFVKLYQQSQQIHKELLCPSKKRSHQRHGSKSNESLYLAGLNDLVSAHFQCKVGRYMILA